MKESNTKRNLIITAVLGLVVAVGVSVTLSNPIAPKPETKIDVTNANTLIPSIVSNVKGFTTGNKIASDTVIVFFDAQCPHCKHLWEAAQGIKSSKVKFLWVPVGLLNKSSYTQGIAILNSKDPVSTMIEHEKLLNPPTSMGLSASDLTAEGKAQILANSEILLQLFKEDQKGVPFIVAKNSKTGEVWTKAGALTTEELKVKLAID